MAAAHLDIGQEVRRRRVDGLGERVLVFEFLGPLVVFREREGEDGQPFRGSVLAFEPGDALVFGLGLVGRNPAVAMCDEDHDGLATLYLAQAHFEWGAVFGGEVLHGYWEAAGFEDGVADGEAVLD
ncbi:MAG: hypothetical protein U0Q16_09250 [Bryobacteraceae bacterium]